MIALKFDEDLLKYDEKAVLKLRGLYRKYGYSQFVMSKFEEYDLYSENKDFLVSDGVITFNDTNGKLLALKPDVTLSIIKNHKDTGDKVDRFYYNENVYRISESSHTYKEIMQTGLECIGKLSKNEVFEVATLACKSLELLSGGFVLRISHIGLVNALLDEYQVADRAAVIGAIADKNRDGMRAALSASEADIFERLIKSYPSANAAFSALGEIAISEKSAEALGELRDVCENLSSAGYEKNICIDFSIINLGGYYSGIVFKGYINGISAKVLSGGRYDKLMRRVGKTSGAVGFAVYLDTLERAEAAIDTDMEQYINVALPKGRLGEKVYAMFEAAGYECPAIKEQNRKLIFENKEKKVRYFWVKPSDVAIYVERGAADIGVAGKDILLEYLPDVYELLDLDIGKCRMAVAAKKDFHDDAEKTLRVATKFSNIARTYYAEQCRNIDIIHLNGSIEIAPILGLSDVIVDIVETGKTLLENDLVPYETIVPISARLISNKSSYGFKTEKIEKIKEELYRQVKKND